MSRYIATCTVAQVLFGGVPLRLGTRYDENMVAEQQLRLHPRKTQITAFELLAAIVAILVF